MFLDCTFFSVFCISVSGILGRTFRLFTFILYCPQFPNYTIFVFILFPFVFHFSLFLFFHISVKLFYPFGKFFFLLFFPSFSFLLLLSPLLIFSSFPFPLSLVAAYSEYVGFCNNFFLFTVFLFPFPLSSFLVLVDGGLYHQGVIPGTSLYMRVCITSVLFLELVSIGIG